FYARRFRRLLPAAAVVLVATAAAYATFASPAEVEAAADDIRAAALYFANWHFISQSADYFGSDIGASPVIHFWSLAVEEQFYVLWPLLLTAMVAVARRFGDRWRLVVGAIVTTGLVASLIAALVLASSNLNRAYYGTDTRAYQ